MTRAAVAQGDLTRAAKAYHAARQAILRQRRRAYRAGHPDAPVPDRLVRRANRAEAALCGAAMDFGDAEAAQ